MCAITPAVTATTPNQKAPAWWKRTPPSVLTLRGSSVKRSFCCIPMQPINAVLRTSGFQNLEPGCFDWLCLRLNLLSFARCSRLPSRPRGRLRRRSRWSQQPPAILAEIAQTDRRPPLFRLSERTLTRSTRRAHRLKSRAGTSRARKSESRLSVELLKIQMKLKRRDGSAPHVGHFGRALR